MCASSEQHAADELLQLAVKGGDIDGQVLAYLEVAQVCPDTDILYDYWWIPSSDFQILDIYSCV